jgi:hypothetical protein
MSQFYSYLWLRSDGSPYYVGKGTERRAFVSFSHGVHCPKDRTRILVFPTLSEAAAFEVEVAMIAFFGRKDNGTGCLRNLTDGGEGAAGFKRSYEACQKQSQSMKGRVFSEEHRRRLSEASKGKIFSAETRRRLSEAHKGKHHFGHRYSESSRQKMRASSKRRWESHPMSEETKSKLRLFNLGRPGPNKGKKASEDAKRKMSEAHKRVGISPETRRKMAANVGRSADGRLCKLCRTDPQAATAVPVVTPI